MNSFRRTAAPTGRHRSRARTIAVPAIALAMSCSHDSSGVTSPPTTHQRVAVGDTVIGVATNGSPDVHTFRGQSGQWVSLEFELPSGIVHLQMTDSATTNPVYSGGFTAGADFQHSATPPFSAANVVYQVTVTTSSTSPVHFRYIVYPVNTAPENSPALLTYGQAVAESLNSAADIDDFRFDAAANDTILFFVQGLEPTSPPQGDIQVQLWDDTTATIVWAIGTGAGDPDSQSVSSRRRVLPHAGRYRLDVVSIPIGPYRIPYVGRYRLEILHVNSAPEHLSSTVTPGDTIAGERLDYVGDIDEFKLNAAAGEEYNVFLQASPGPPENAFTLNVIAPSGTQVGLQFSKGTDSLTLLQNSVGRFKAAESGPYRLQVLGWYDYGTPDRGPYRLLAEKVNRAPEHISGAPRTFGDTISGETIDFPGDIDDIPVNIVSPTLVHIETWRLAGGPQGSDLLFRFARASDDSVLGASAIDLYASQSPPRGGGTATMRVPAGSYILHAQSDDPKFGYMGGWKAIIQRIDSMPESRAMMFAPGDTVTETIDPPGDADIYDMPVQVGDHFSIYYQGTYNGGSGTNLDAWLTPITLLHPFPDVSIGTSPSAGLSDAPHSSRLDAYQAGTWRIQVSTDGADPTKRGPYRFMVAPYSGALEHHSPSTLAIGDSVTDEMLDVPYDLDEYDLVGPPNDEVILTFSGDLSTGTGMTLVVVDTAAHQVVAQMQSFISRQTTHRFRLPSSGRVRIDAMEPYNDQNRAPYFLSSTEVHRTPEHVPAAYVVGDTVTGESIDYMGDVDEFTFNATAGERIRAFLDPVTGSGNSPMLLEISHAGSDVALDSVIVWNPDPGLDSGTVGLTIPSTGTYVVRVRWDTEYSPESPRPYRFYVRDEP